MLVLTRRVNETIVIEGGIRVTVVAIKGDKVRLGIEAPESVRVDREEVHDRRAEMTDEPIVRKATRPDSDALDFSWRKRLAGQEANGRGLE
jgi:carbon storage regulator